MLIIDEAAYRSINYQQQPAQILQAGAFSQIWQKHQMFASEQMKWTCFENSIFWRDFLIINQKLLIYYFVTCVFPIWK